jgi:hypothetical protein
MTTDTFIKELERTRDETLRYFASGTDDLARTYGPGKWSVRYLLHHLTDSETVFFDRIRRVLSEPRQVIWVYDQEAWARKLDYAALPLEISRPIYESVRAGIVHYAGRHYDGSDKLEFVHSVTGVRTLRDEFEKVVTHNEKHLGHIRLALNGT